jgi:hypothetical protein
MQWRYERLHEALTCALNSLFMCVLVLYFLPHSPCYSLLERERDNLQDLKVGCVLQVKAKQVFLTTHHRGVENQGVVPNLFNLADKATVQKAMRERLGVGSVLFRHAADTVSLAKSRLILHVHLAKCGYMEDEWRMDSRQEFHDGVKQRRHMGLRRHRTGQ